MSCCCQCSVVSRRPTYSRSQCRVVASGRPGRRRGRGRRRGTPPVGRPTRRHEPGAGRRCAAQPCSGAGRGARRRAPPGPRDRRRGDSRASPFGSPGVSFRRVPLPVIRAPARNRDRGRGRPAPELATTRVEQGSHQPTLSIHTPRSCYSRRVVYRTLTTSCDLRQADAISRDQSD